MHVGTTVGAAPGGGATTTVTRAGTTLQIATAPWQLPSPRAREIVLAGTHALYVIGGLDAGKSSTGRVWNVALPSGTTTRLAVLPQVLHDSAGAVLGEAVFVFGGGAGTELATVQRYRAGAATVVGQLPQPRSDLAAVAIDGTAYVFGGFDGTRGVASVLATTDGTSFQSVASLAQTVRYAAVAAHAGRIYVFGGDHNGTNVATVQIIDPHARTSSIVDQLPYSVTEATAVELDGQLLVIGGRSHGRILDTVVRYDPVSGKSTTVGHLPYPVIDAGAAVVDGVAYVVGGETPAEVGSVITLRHA